MKTSTTLPILLLFMFFLQSCKDEYTFCNQSKDVIFNAGFYQKIGATETTATAPNLSVYILNNTSPILAGQSTSTFSLPFNPLLDTTKLQISIASGTTPDTLMVVYTTTPTILSTECGGVNFHNIVNVLTTTHTIDSAKTIQPAITNTPTQNIKIYF